MLTSIVGAILWWLFVEQWYLGVDWPVVRAWQTQFVYKVATGAGLAAFICFQWLFAICRMAGWTRAAKALHPWHQTLGVLAPVLLFFHSTRLGFGYIVLLTSVFFANNLVGLANPSAFSALKRVLAIWTIAHIALSVVLVALATYHAWTALYYE